jgi:hypothetical protein
MVQNFQNSEIAKMAYLNSILICEEYGGEQVGICIENKEYVLGLKEFHIDVHRSEGLERIIYSFRHWMDSALKGFPYAISLLWAPVHEISYTGETLRFQAPDHLVSRQTGKAYAEKMRSELHMLTTDDSYDKEQAARAITVGMQGKELMQTGAVSVRLDKPDDLCYNIREGRIPFSDLLELASNLHNELAEAIKDTELRREPDYEWANKCLTAAYLEWWGYGTSNPYQ